MPANSLAVVKTNAGSCAGNEYGFFTVHIMYSMKALTQRLPMSVMVYAKICMAIAASLYANISASILRKSDLRLFYLTFSSLTSMLGYKFVNLG